MNLACENCGAAFEATAKRRTCTRSCAVKLSWKNPEAKAARQAGISKSKQTPEAMARLAAHNKRRWAKPGEREKLSEQNRKEWANPKKRKKRAASIKRSHGRPEMRAHYSRMRTEQWANDPEYRRKTTEGLRRALGSPEHRDLFSRLLRERWEDPEMRAKYTAANHARNNPQHAERQRQRMLKRWHEDDAFRALVAASMEFYWSKPESREHHSQMLKTLWSDPVWRMRQLKLINDSSGFTSGKITAHLTSASDMMGAVNAVIPRALPDFMRMDIASDIMLALLEGDLKMENLRSEAKVFMTAHRKMFPDKWGPISIDAPLPGTDGFTIADTLSNDSPHF